MSVNTYNDKSDNESDNESITDSYIESLDILNFIESEERSLYKSIKNNMKDLLLYIRDEDIYKMERVDYKKFINNIISFLTTYNVLTKKYNKKFGIPDKQKRTKYNKIYFKMISELHRFKQILNHKQFLNLKYVY
jgi:hypothetical protein